MATINFRQKSAEQLDIEKRVLESSVIVDLQRTFRNMANDASNLYIATGNLPSQQLANNYAPEFLKEIRDAMRKSIKKFGFNLRKAVEKKHGLFFDAENKISFIGMNLKQSVTIIDEDLDPKLDKINNEFIIASTLFVANESEVQNNFVTNTNINMLDAAVITGISQFSNSVAVRESRLRELNSSLLTAPSNRRGTILRQIEAVRRQINESNVNRQEIVGRNIRTNILAKAPARSELIASQNIGLAESWARQTEARLINNAALINEDGQLIQVTKEWKTILDSHTRSSHVEADGQEVGVNEDYIVQGERLNYPRSPQGSASNILNCRCISDFSV